MEQLILEHTLLSGKSENNVFKNVKLFGKNNRMGRKYSDKAVSQLVKLYQNAYVYVDHQDPKLFGKVGRSYNERVGEVKNPVLIDNEIYGDLYLNPKKAITESLVWDIENLSNGIGISHSIVGDETNGVIDYVKNVNSLDIVSDPSTTKTFYESYVAQIDNNKLITEQHIKENEELKEINDKLIEEINILKEETSKQLKLINEIMLDVKNIKKTPRVAVMPQDNNLDNYNQWLNSIRTNNIYNKYN